jgi:hypothetical protein
MRERAYRFVENRAVRAAAQIAAMSRAVAARINALALAYVVLDPGERGD